MIRTQLERRLDSLTHLAHKRGRLSQEDILLHGTLATLVQDGTEMYLPRAGWSAAERRLIQLLSRATKLRFGQCYANAQRAVLIASELDAASSRQALLYCEGYAHLELPAPFAHGWCLLNGRVWDPTLDPLLVTARYLGVSMPTEFVRSIVAERDGFGPMIHLWQDRLRRGNGRGYGPPNVERTVRVASAVGQGGGLGGAEARV